MKTCKDIFTIIEKSEKEYVNFWEEFCNIESPTDYKEGVDASGNYIIQKAMQYGWQIERQPQSISGNCICITMNPEAKKSPVCLSGHLDTVHPVGLFGTPAVTFANGNIYGPGVADCKGGIVAAFMAMAALEAVDFRDRPVKLILQSDEETSSAGSSQTTIKYMCECAKDAVAFLNCEPTGAGTFVLQRKGIAKYTFDITGKAAHAAACYNGVSAIAEAAHKILALEQYKDIHGITANCGIISGGTKINTVPEKCTVQVDFRFSNEKELSEVHQIAQTIADTSYITGTTCKLTLESLRDAMELTDTNIRLLQDVNTIFAANQLPQLTMRIAGGGSDAAYTTKCGIPTLDSVGVECDHIHSRNESSPVRSLTEAAKRIAAICYCI